jgi:hypothetical protein
MNLDNLRQRYLKDNLSIRLAGIAANLLRISNFSKHAGHYEVVTSIVKESKWFIEWTAAELQAEQAAELVHLQVLLALWELQSQNNWSIENWRSSLSSQAKEWSARIFKMSGLNNDA